VGVCGGEALGLGVAHDVGLQVQFLLGQRVILLPDMAPLVCCQGGTSTKGCTTSPVIALESLSGLLRGGLITYGRPGEVVFVDKVAGEKKSNTLCQLARSNAGKAAKHSIA
jgi:hypothetical protein